MSELNGPTNVKGPEGEPGPVPCVTDYLTAKGIVQIELAQLEQRFDKLKAFLESDKCNTVSEHQRNLMWLQYWHMRGYISVLEARLRHWED